MANIYRCVTGVEPVSNFFGEAVGNIATYNVISGNAPTYSISDMVVTSALGVITHNSIQVATISDTVTLVADSADPRWSYFGRDATGDLVLVSGDPAINPTVPEPIDVTGVGLVKIQANQTIAANCTSRIDKRIPAVPQPTVKYKSATQVITTSTVLVDVIAAGTPATMSFAIGAGEVWEAEYWVPLAFGGTGGAKFQLTGPAAATGVNITGTYVQNDTSNTVIVPNPFAPVTAFSADIASAASGGVAAGAGTYYNAAAAGANSCFINIRVRIINGVNAGTVTLQAAQNNSNSTTTLGLGSIMNARRIP